MGSLACGVGLGGGCFSLAQVIVALLQAHLDPTTYREAAPDPLFAGLLAGVTVAAGFGWRRSHALDNLWQRGVISVLAAVGALLVGFFAQAAYRFFGMVGVLVWAALAVACGVAGSAWAIRGAGGDRP